MPDPFNPYDPLEWYDRDTDGELPEAEDEDPLALFKGCVSAAILMLCLIAAGFAAYHLG